MEHNGPTAALLVILCLSIPALPTFLSSSLYLGGCPQWMYFPRALLSTWLWFGCSHGSRRGGRWQGFLSLLLSLFQCGTGCAVTVNTQLPRGSSLSHFSSLQPSVKLIFPQSLPPMDIEGLSLAAPVGYSISWGALNLAHKPLIVLFREDP